MIEHKDYKSLCHGCQRLQPTSKMIHAYDGKLYCSKGCVAKARWIFENIPLPRESK